MENETKGKEEQEHINLYVLLPDCKECRDRITRDLMRMEVWDEVSFGYPDIDGSIVSLYYTKAKHPQVDYWEKALKAKKILEDSFYRVL